MEKLLPAALARHRARRLRNVNGARAAAAARAPLTLRKRLARWRASAAGSNFSIAILFAKSKDDKDGKNNRGHCFSKVVWKFYFRNSQIARRRATPSWLFFAAKTTVPIGFSRKLTARSVILFDTAKDRATPHMLTFRLTPRECKATVVPFAFRSKSSTAPSSPLNSCLHHWLPLQNITSKSKLSAKINSDQFTIRYWISLAHFITSTMP